MKRLQNLSYLCILSLIFLALPNQQVFGQTKHDTTKKAVKAVQSVTSHSVTINGKTIHYKAIAGILPIYDNHHNPIAKIDYTAYIKKGVKDPAQRPVIFGYNGGPGSSSIYVHLGVLGPKRVKLNDPNYVRRPYQLINNQYSPLDVSDVVIVDMVGSGYSRAAGGKKASYFWGVNHDGQSFSNFIKEFLITNHRVNSPLYLFGESYGSLRSAVIASDLLRNGIALNGIIMIGTILDWSYLGVSRNENLAYMFYLPSYAAVAWHYNKVSHSQSSSLSSYVEKVRKFAVNEYEPALLKGSNLSSSERNKIAGKVSQYIGLSKDFIKRANLRIEPSVFRKRLLRDEGKIIGRYDGRYKNYATNPVSNREYGDPSSSRITPAFETMFLKYYHQDLKFGKNMKYLFSAYGANFNWKWDTHDVAPRLARTMVKNPQLRVHVISGYFDTATPFFGSEYSFSQMNIPDSLRSNIGFTYVKAGHMSYLRLSALKKMHQVMEKFIK